MSYTPSKLEAAKNGQDRTVAPSAIDLDTAWGALSEDSGISVCIMNATGHFLAANDATTSVLTSGTQRAPLVGASINEIMGEPLAQERLNLVQEVIASQQPIALEGMIHGRMVRSVFRPAMKAGITSVLITSRVCTETAPSAPATIPTRRALHNDQGSLAALTGRELDILKLIGKGLSTAEIATSLGRSVKTVEWHRVALGEKLGISNRVELARIAIASGLVSTIDQPATAPSTSSKSSSPTSASATSSLPNAAPVNGTPTPNGTNGTHAKGTNGFAKARSIRVGS